MSQILVDTGPLIRHLRNEQQTIQLLRSLNRRDRLVISAITRTEIRSHMMPEERFATQKLLSRFITIDFDKEIADRTGDLRNTFRLQGLTIGFANAATVATALTYNLTILTYNQKDFEQMPGLLHCKLSYCKLSFFEIFSLRKLVKTYFTLYLRICPEIGGNGSPR